VKVAVKPPVEIEGYKDHGIKKETKEVDDAAIEARLKELAEKNVRFVEADRAAQNGDTTVIDFEGFVDGTAFAGGKGEGYSLTLGSNQFIPGFEEQIAGHGNGEEFDVNVSFPEDYHAPELAGKPAVFKVKLNEIKTKEYPEIDDEFAKDASEFDTLAELKADIAEKLKKEYEDAAENKFENEIIDKLCETAKIDIPNAMLEDRIDENYRNFEYSIRAKGISVEDYFKYTGMSADAMRVTLKPQSERQIKLRLILETIAKLENLTATEEEIASEYEKLAGQYAMDADKLKSLVPKSEIAADVATQKAMDFVKNAG
jgi:trigger factor